MVDVFEVEVSLGATIPTGQYANITPNISMKAHVKDGEDSSVVAEELMREIRLHLSVLAGEVAQKRMAVSMPIDEIMEFIHKVKPDGG